MVPGISIAFETMHEEKKFRRYDWLMSIGFAKNEHVNYNVDG